MDINAWFQKVIDEFITLLKAPVIAPEMWWIITPLIVITLLMTFYFGKYVREKLGWNTALGNSIVLFFVGIDLLREIYNYTVPGHFLNFAINPLKTTVILAVMFEGILLTYTAFEHALPPKVMFFIASPLPVNLQAYVLTAIIYLRMKPTLYTLAAAVLLFIVLFFILRMLQEIENLQMGMHKPKPAKKEKPAPKNNQGRQE